jgi:photosystem II stability/assembly factor-like uncharacterized protein
MKLTRWALIIPAFVLTTLAAAAAARAQENAWVSHGPTDVGWVNDLAIAGSVSYAATLNGVFRSEDRGVSWQQSGLTGESLFQVVARPGATVVLATSYGYDQNLYASLDGGGTWAPIPGLPTVLTAAIDPGHLSTLYAGGADATIWKSVDAGTSWQQVSTASVFNNEPVQAFAFDSRAIYVQTYENLFKSTDGGVTWLGVGPPLGGVLGPNVTIAAGLNPGVVYAAIANNFCRSADSAATWTCTIAPFSVGYSTSPQILEVPGKTPSTPLLFATGGDRAFVSRDGGATWAPVGGGLEATKHLHVLGSDAAGSLLLVGTDTRVFRSQDRGESWTSSSSGLKSVSIGTLVLDPKDPSTVWAGGPGLFRSTDSGFSWSPAGGSRGQSAVAGLVIDPDQPSTMYAGFETLYRTADGGQTWTESHPASTTGLSALALDPVAPQRVWAAFGSNLFRSDDGARTWGPPASIAQAIYGILIDPRHPNTIYAGSYFDVDLDYNEPYGGSIFVSHDAGASFSKEAQNLGFPVQGLAADPFEDGIFYVAAGMGGVLRSADGGASWENASAGLPNTVFGIPFYSYVSQIIADPVHPGRLYCATADGVFQTLDGAQTWLPLSTGLTTLSVASLAISPDGKRLHAGTGGGGVFELDLEARPPAPCVPSDSTLCLVGGRYQVELAARRGDGPLNPGAARSLGDRAGYFALPFVTGDPELPEVAVKMLADGSFGASGAPIFYSSLTTIPFLLTVTDTVTGETKTYASDADRPLCGGTQLLFRDANAESSELADAAAGGDDDEPLTLLNGRFTITLEARHPRSGAITGGQIILAGNSFGVFSLPGITGDPQFPEVVVKMVDARSFAGRFWFFQTGLTSLDYTLTVTDSVTGAVRTYVGATPFCGIADTDAFTDSPANPSGIDLNGFWTGTMEFPSDCFTCPREEVQVTLSQVRNAVTGHLATKCVGNRQLRGTLDGDQLTFDFDPISGTGSSAAPPPRRPCTPRRTAIPGATAATTRWRST